MNTEIKPMPLPVSFLEWVSFEKFLRLSEKEGYRWFKSGDAKTYSTLELYKIFENEIDDENAQFKSEPVKSNEGNVWVTDVLKFHKSMEVDYHLTPFIPTNDRKELRKNILNEEIKELEKAMDENDIISISDGIVDSIYVLIGTAWEFGLGKKLTAIWDEVQRSNMSKLDDNGKPVKRDDGKVLKSKNFFKPNLEKIIYSDLTPIKSNDERNEKYWNGFKFACEMLDETYSDCSIHRYMLGDCLLAKVNKLKGKIRENLKANKQNSNDVGDVEKAAKNYAIYNYTKAPDQSVEDSEYVQAVSFHSFKAGIEWQSKNG